ncbi:hypothetical protein ACNJUT_21835, partial [Mycobacterium tuberculosis]
RAQARAGLDSITVVLEKTGAGEEIRTLDPNLGKVGITCFPSLSRYWRHWIRSPSRKQMLLWFMAT